MKKLALVTVIAIASSAAMAQGARNDAPPASPAASEAQAKTHGKKHERHKKDHHQANHGTEVKGVANEGKAPAK